MTNSINPNNPYAALQASTAKTEETKSQNSLDQDAFMQLLIAQMKNQDPTEPVDASEQLVQLAQFSQVEGLDQLNAQMESLVAAQTSTQALQASSLVGRSVTVNNDSFNYQGGSVGGLVDLPAGGNVEISVMDAIGQEVDRISLGQQTAGEVAFNWPGGSSSGQHRFVANVTEGDLSYGATVMLNANVNSVSLNGNTTTLNLNGIGPVSMNDVRAITESNQGV